MFTTKILVTRICMLAATLIFSVTWLIVLVVYIRPNNEPQVEEPSGHSLLISPPMLQQQVIGQRDRFSLAVLFNNTHEVEWEPKLW